MHEMNDPRARKGRSGDTILAHINPQEAKLLKALGGSGTINPATGLREYKGGFFKSLARIAATVAGAYYGGPAGAGAGNALSGKLTGRKNKGMKDFLVGSAMAAGAGHGLRGLGSLTGKAGLSALGNTLKGGSGLGSFLGSKNNSGLSRLIGVGKGGLPELIGGSKGVLSGDKEGGAGLLGNLISGGGKDKGSGMDKLLMATMLYGGLKGKAKKDPEDDRQQNKMRMAMDRNALEQAPIQYPKVHQVHTPPPAGYRPGIDPEWQSFRYVNDAGQPVDNMGQPIQVPPAMMPLRRAAGGYIQKRGASGIADDVSVKLKAGSYVWNGMDVALIGDGNTEHGAKKIKEFEDKRIKIFNDKFVKSGVHRQTDQEEKAQTRVSYAQGGLIDALVSDGEYIMDRRAVASLGNGSTDKGAKVIDKMRKNLREHKGVMKVVLPRTKVLERYLGD